MRCPNCGSRTKKNICEHCKIKYIKEKNNSNIFLLLIIIASIILIFVVLYLLMFNKEPANTPVTTTTTTTIKLATNKGRKNSYINPANVGEIILGSYYDGSNYYDVDVLGVKFYEPDELSEYKLDIEEGFNLYGFKYKVTFNDLINNNNINPVLKSEVKMGNGNKFIKINEEKVSIDTTNIYKGTNIKNGESAEVLVLYKLPSDITDYSICIGESKINQACFKKEVSENE